MKINSNTFILWIYIIGIIFCGIVTYSPFCTDKSLFVQFCVLLVMAIGSIFGFYKYNQIKSEYLDLLVETKSENNIHSIKTQVFNKSGVKKSIEYAFILITRQEVNILDAISNFINTHNWDIDINCTDNFKCLRNRIEIPTLDNNMYIIPLRFYYSENIQIGNESPSYTYSFNNNDLNLECGIYSVRFFIYPKSGLHRSTVDSLIIT